MLAVDITEFLGNPIRTGIQRVVRELLSRWPRDIAKEVVAFDATSNRFRSVNPSIVDYCIAQSTSSHLAASEVAEVIATSIAASPALYITLKRGDRLLIPELFSASARVRFYLELESAGVELFAIVYDLLLWTSPHVWNISYVGGLNDYLGLLLLAKERAFISASVRQAFYERFLRKPVGPDLVVPLGSDSLKPRQEQAPQRERPYFVSVGTLDGKKGQDRIYSAYLASSARHGIDLIFAGKVPAAPRKEMLPLLSSMNENVEVVDDPDDVKLASLVQHACASVFVSRHEGFGLPAVESLYLGTPLVVASDLPAISHLGPHGQIRLESSSEQELIAALDSLARPELASALKAQIALLKLETWSNYSRNIAVWASS